MSDDPLAAGRHDVDHYVRELVRLGIERHQLTRTRSSRDPAAARLRPEEAAALRAALEALAPGRDTR